MLQIVFASHALLLALKHTPMNPMSMPCEYDSPGRPPFDGVELVSRTSAETQTSLRDSNFMADQRHLYDTTSTILIRFLTSMRREIWMHDRARPWSQVFRTSFSDCVDEFGNPVVGFLAHVR